MDDPLGDTFQAAAYGGPGWRPRERDHAGEIGPLWRDAAVADEWSPLRAVLLHRPGDELAVGPDADRAQMIAPPAPARVRAEHDALAAAYEAAGIAVHYVAPAETPPPNQMFVADLMFMTPEGAILARPASAVRAGEERWVARRLADLGVPILRTLTGTATFEGADALWLDRETVLIGRGLRTNDDGIRQVSATLAEIGARAIPVDLPFGTMHLMGMLRIVAPDLAIAWPRRTPHAAVAALRERGYRVLFLPDDGEAQRNHALNIVTLAPRRVVMIAGNPTTQAFYEDNGIDCVCVPADELIKAAGGVGCLTGVLARERSADRREA